MKKNIFYISVLSCAFCMTLSTVAFSTSFTDSLVNYCVPKAGNNCDPKSDKATYTSSGCSCNIGREYDSGDRKCVECLLKGGGYNGYYKSNVGVEKCSQIVCPGGSYLTHVTSVDKCPGGSYREAFSCGMGNYYQVLQQD